MKVIRILTLCLLALLITMSTVHAQISFIVVSPKAGDSWKTGETKNIEWSYSSPQSISQNWKLVLMKGSTVLGTIVDNVSGNSFSWRVGQYLGGMATPGADYRIQISHVTSTLVSNNSGFFSILYDSIAMKKGPSKPSMTPEKKPELVKEKPKLVKVKPKLELRKPNLMCSVGAFYDSYCTQEIPLIGYYYQTAPSPKFIYFLIKIKNLGNPANDIDWKFHYEEGYWGRAKLFGTALGNPTWLSESSTYIDRELHLWGLAANEEYRFTQRSNRVELDSSHEHTYVNLEVRLDQGGKIAEESEDDNGCSRWVEVIRNKPLERPPDFSGFPN